MNVQAPKLHTMFGLGLDSGLRKFQTGGRDGEEHCVVGPRGENFMGSTAEFEESLVKVCEKEQNLLWASESTKGTRSEDRLKASQASLRSEESKYGKVNTSQSPTLSAGRTNQTFPPFAIFFDSAGVCSIVIPIQEKLQYQEERPFASL
ncbi:hypothetical protein JHW43_005578 [Diplocarpon mali]|nr:hypothetical protein JHW43_005578 [Diplocarpon mali]